MLLLKRTIDEGINIGDEIEIVVVEVRGKKVVIGIKAPTETKILRSELKHQPACATDARATPTEPHEA